MGASRARRAVPRTPCQNSPGDGFRRGRGFRGSRFACCLGLLTAAVALCAPTASAQTTPTVTLSVPADTAFAEGEGSTTVTVTATLSAARAGNTVVDLSLGGTAKSTDYAVVQLPDITISAGQTRGTADLILRPVDDGFFEGEETVSIGGDATGLTVNAVNVALDDNETAPSLVVTSTRTDEDDVFLEEGESARFRITVVLGGARLEEDATISLTLTNTAGQFSLELEPEDIDFGTTAPPWSLEISGGKASATMDLMLTVVDDELEENQEFAALRASVTVAGTTIAGVGSFLNVLASDQPTIFSVLCSPGEAYVGDAVSCYPSVGGQATSRNYSLTMSWSNSTLVSPASKVFAIGSGRKEQLLDLATDFTFSAAAVGRTVTISMEVTPNDRGERASGGSGGVYVYPASDSSHEITNIQLHNFIAGVVGPRRQAFGFFLGPDAPRPVKPEGTRKHMEVVLDSGIVAVPCKTDISQIFCSYIVQDGDYDFDGRIEVPAGAVKFTRWRDVRDTAVTGPVASPLPAQKTTFNTPGMRIYGGSAAIDLSVSPQTVQEGSGEQALTIVAVNRAGSAASADLVLPLQFTNVSTSNADYSVRGPLSVTIPRGQVEGRTTAVLFTPTDDLRREDRLETVRIEGSKGAMMTPFVRGADLKILDAAGIALSVSPARIAEDGAATQVRVTAAWGDAADSTLARDVEVALAWGGTAGAGDYARAGGTTVTIPANARSGTTTVTITPTDDNLLEGDETIVIGGSAAGRPVASAELTLADDETVPAVTLSVDTAAVSESGAAVSVTVSAELDPEVAMANDVTTVTLELGGTATAGTDYSATWSPASRQIAIPRESTLGSNTVTLTLTPTDDSVAEGDETIVVQGTATTDRASRNLVVKVATIALEDDDALGVNLSPKTLTVEEGAADTYEVWLGAQPTGDVTVTLSSTDATTATVDQNELTFTSTTWNTRQTVTLTGQDDDRNNADDRRTAAIRHTASGGGYDGLAAVVLPVTVTDDDEAASFSIGDASVTEGQTASFTVTRRGATGDAATVTWSTAEDADGDHPASSADYTAQAAAQTLSFAGGETSKTITVRTAQDTLDEDDETFLVVLSSPSTGTSIADGTATGTIIDDDATTAELSIAATAAVSEGAADATATMSFAVNLSAASGRRVTVDYADAGSGTATSGTDYSSVTAGTLTFAAGETSKTVAVTVNGDDVDEDNETVTLRLSSPTNARFAAGATTLDATGTITDDDTKGVTVSAASAGLTIRETDDGGTTETTENVATYTVVLTSQPTDDVVIGLSVPAGAPFTTSPSSLTFTPDGAGIWSTAQVVTVTAVDDNVDNTGNQRSASITHALTVGSSDYGGVSVPGVTVTVTDDDAAPTALTLTVDADTETDNVQTSVSEGGGAKTVRVTATLDGSTTFATDKTVTVEVGKSSDSATEGTDYARVATQTITIGAGASSGRADFTLTPTDDAVDEESETISLDGTLAGVTVTDAVITLTDDDDAPGGIALSVDTDSVMAGSQTEVGEAAGATTVTVTATVTGSTTYSGAQTVAVSVSGDTATVTDDFAAVTGFSITIPAGTASARGTFTLTPVADAVDEDDETVDVTGTVSGDGAPAVTGATITITDDDTKGVTVSAASAGLTIRETDDGGTPATENVGTYTVVLASEPTDDVVIDVEVPAGAPFTAAPSSLTFTPGGAGIWSTAKVVTVTAVDDSVDNTGNARSASITHALTVGNSDYGGVSVPDVAVTVTDDDAAPTALTLTVDADTETDNVQSSVSEGGGAKTVRVTATLGGSTTFATDKAVTVEVGDDGDSAAEGTDYAMVGTQSVTIKAGASSGHADFTLTPTADSLHEGPETISVEGALSGVTVAGAEITITDDDAAPTTATLAVDADTETDNVQSSVSEGGGAKTVRVTATLGGSSTFTEAKTVTVEVGHADDGATEGTDYANVGRQEIEIAAGASSGHADFTLTPTDDAVDEESETISFKGTADGLTVADAEITLTDDDTKGVTVSAAAAGLTVRETDDGGTTETTENVATYTVVLASQPTGDVVIDVEVPAGAPFTASPSRLTFTPSGAGLWSSPQVVTVTAVDDNVDNTGNARSAEITHTLTVGRSDYGGVSVPAVTVTVSDDDAAPSGITLTTDTPTIAEDAATKMVKVTATVNGDTTYAEAKTVRVTVGTNGDSATSGDDYATVTAFDIEIEAGEMSGEQTFSLNPADDAIDEDSESIRVSGTSGNIEITDASIEITDNDTRGVTVTGSPLTMLEADNPATNSTREDQATYTVVLDSEPTDDVTINIGVPEGAPFTVSDTGLDFTPSTWSTAQTVTVTAVDDNVDNTGDMRSVVISHTVDADGTDYEDETAPDVTVTVTDDDAAPTALTLTVDADTGTDNVQTSVSEGGGAKTVRVTATLDGSTTFAVDKTVTVEVGHADDSATEGTDYAMVVTQTITLKAGASSGHVDFTLTPANDDVDEENETISLKGTAAGLTVADAVITLTDDDTKGVTVSAASAGLTIRETDDAGTTETTENVATYTVVLASQPTDDVVIDVSVPAGAPFTASPSSLTFTPSGAGLWSTAQRLTVTAVDDNVDNTGNQRSASITHALTVGRSDYGGVSVPGVTVTVTDDDAAPTALTLTVDADTETDNVQASVSEGGGAKTVRVTATLGGSTTFATDKTVTVEVGHADDSATEGADYAMVGTQSITIKAGASSAHVDFALTLTADSLHEGSETISFKGTAAGVTVAGAEITITDDDAAPTALTLTVDADTGTNNVQNSLAEGGGAKTVRVTATLGGSSTFAVDKTVTVEVGHADDSATEGTDYTRVATQTITLKAGASSGHVDFTLTPTDDAVDEESETISFKGTATGLTVADATITITDDDTKGVTVSAAAAGLTIRETDDGSTAQDEEHKGTYTIVLDSQPTGAVVVNISVPEGAPFTASPPSLTFNPSGAGLWSTAQEVTVTAVDDSVDNTGNARSASITHSLTVGSSDYGGVSVPDVTVTVTDDDAAPTGLTLTVDADTDTPAAQTSVSEGGGAKTVRVTATLGGSTTFAVDKTVTVEVGKSSDSATEGTDYARVATQSITLKAGASSGHADFTLTPTDDLLFEGDETISLNGTLAGVTVTDAEITLTDDETVPAVTLLVDPDAVSESGGTRTVTVSAVLDPTVAMANDTTTVTLSLGGTATAGTDYTSSWSPSTPVIAFPVGETKGANTVTLTLTPTDDSGAEDDETVVIQGTATTQSRSLVVKVAVITLEDDDAPGVNLSPRSLTVTEGAAATYDVWLGTQPSQDVTVTLSGLDATMATADRGSLTFTQTTWNIRQQVTVSGEEDDLDNAGDKRVTSIRHSAAGGRYDNVDDAVLNVTVADNDDAPSFSIGDASAAEGDAVTFTVNRAGAKGAVATVSWQTTDDMDGSHPASTADYTAQATARVLSFAAGDTSKTLTVQTTEDMLHEEDETFLVKLSAPSAGALIDDGTATGTITDDDGAPTTATLTVDADTGTQNIQNSLAEDGGAKTVRVTATLGGSVTFAVDKTVTVEVGNSGDTATEGTDYQTVGPQSITITAGSSSGYKDFTLTPIQDQLAEGDETISFKGTAAGLTVADAEITLTDDDSAPTTATLTVDADTGTGSVQNSLAEDGGAKVVRVTATLGGSVTFTADKTVTVEVGDDDDSAAEGTDYATVGTQTVTIKAGASSGHVDFTLTPTQDQLAEGGETISFKGTAAGLTVADAEITLTDDDSAPTTATLAVDADTGTGNVQNSLAEDGGAKTVRVTATLGGSVTFTADKTVTVEVGDDDDSAAEGTDYATVGTQTVTIKAGASSGHVDFTLTPTQDQLAEGGETISFKGTAAGLTVADATITLTDDDDAPTTATLTVDADTGTGNVQNSLAEDGGAKVVQVTAMLGGSTTFAVDKTVTVEVGHADDSATEGTDYAMVGTQSITITAGTSSGQVDFTLTPTADLLHEGDETISVEGALSEVSVTGATITITDDDAARMITVLLSASDYEVFEGESLTVKVNLSESRAADTVIALDPATRTGQTATRGVDYDGSMRTVTILAGETSGTARISTTADDRKDPNETFTVAIQESGLSGDVILGEPHTAVVTIRERVAGVTPPATATVEYKGSDSRITLTVPADLQGNGIDVAFRYGTDKGTARSGGFRCGDDDDADLINREVVGSGTPGEVINRPTLRRMMDLDADTVDLEIELCPGSRGKTFDVIWDTALYLGNPDRGFPGIRSAPFDAAAAHCSSASLCWTRVTIEGGDAVEACVSHSLRETVEFHAGEAHHGDAHVDRWKQVLAAFGDVNGHTAMTAAVAQQNANQFQASRWNPVVTALQCLEAAPAAEDASDQAGPEITVAGGGDIAEGADAVFTVHADPAPASDLTVALAIADDTASDFLAENDEGPKTVTIKAGESSAAYTLTTVDDDVEEADGSVSAMIEAGTGYRVGTPSKVVVAVSDDDDPAPVAPVVNIAGGAGVTEGAPASFTVTANPAPGTPLTVALTIDQSGDYAATGETGVREVVVPTGGSIAFEVATVNDAADEPDGSVTATLAAGAGYAVAASPDDAASVAVADDDVAAADVPTLSVNDVEVQEGSYRRVEFTVTLSEAVEKYVSFYYRVRESSPVSAKRGVDFWASTDKTFAGIRPGQTEYKIIAGMVVADSHDEDPETFEVVLSDANGAAIADGVGVATIVNDDPMPAAFLSRFGRTVAEQALDGIAGRIAAPREAGARGTIAGQALSFGTGSAADGAANDNAATGSFSAAGGFGGLGNSGFGASANGFGMAGFGHDAHLSAGGPGPDSGLGLGESRTMTGLEALLGSSFTATGETDATGGSLAFWGRAAQSSFDGREGTFSLDGEATTAMLGADYARGDWLVGLALMQSSGEGGYADAGTGSVRCPQDLDAETRSVLCGGAVREGDGDVEASLTAAVPYAAIQASERLRLWGAAGFGTGEVTLKPDVGGSLKSDISWTVAAAGARSDLLQPPKEGSGPTLALTADALWTRTSSEKTHELAASDSDVTRLRLGLEGGYAIATEGGGRIVPTVEIGARHDGGDAETGFGVELGGGIAWTDPMIGLSLDLSGRTLVAHGNDDLEDWGFAASLAFDPNPGTERGLSLTLRQDWGGSAQGGLDALFATDPLADRAGTAEATNRWQAEAAYGLPAFSKRFTVSPHAGLGLATGARDYTLGWRLSPATNANVPDVSFGVKATRRESAAAAPEHIVGFELRARW